MGYSLKCSIVLYIFNVCFIKYFYYLAAQERARQLLESRGIQLPKPGEKLTPKKPYYGKPRKNKQQQQKTGERLIISFFGVGFDIYDSFI